MAAQPGTLTRDEIYEGVRKAIAESLGDVAPEDITLELRLVEDLMAESMDILDINLRLESGFGIKMRGEDVFPVASFDVDAPRYSLVDRETYTLELIAQLKRTYRHLQLAEFEAEPSPRNLINSVTVDSLVTYVEKKLGEQHD